MFQVWSSLMSLNLSVTVRFDFERVVQRRYERSEIAAAARVDWSLFCRPWVIEEMRVL